MIVGIIFPVLVSSMMEFHMFSNLINYNGNGAKNRPVFIMPLTVRWICGVCPQIYSGSQSMHVEKSKFALFTNPIYSVDIMYFVML
jgi:hypothetical protein